MLRAGRYLYPVSVDFALRDCVLRRTKYPFHRDLWRKPTASNGWSCTPRTSRIPKTLRVASDELYSLWREYSPVTYARTDALLFWLGIDFSAILFGPVKWFCVDDVITFSAA
ncbi:Mu prophage protein [Escherichia coli]|uniref:Mu prophage protein n=1 Tax=Escherichia coli TaxID=562 RepID=A0A377CXT6_ECOLX|nr:Mu prophage protein [Escherichia coli]